MIILAYHQTPTSGAKLIPTPELWKAVVREKGVKEQVLKREYFALIRPLSFHTSSTLLNISYCSHCHLSLATKQGDHCPCAPIQNPWTTAGCGICLQQLLTSASPAPTFPRLPSASPTYLPCPQQLPSTFPTHSISQPPSLPTAALGHSRFIMG